MVKLFSAKCPNCGASLKLSKDEEMVECEYCHQNIIVDEALACYKLKISGTVSVDGIETNAELVSAANELLNMKEYLKAKRKFLEFSEKCPDNYQGWLGLLICRTRNFTIKDNNIMFENDIEKYYAHFLKTAPNDIKNQYVEIMNVYFSPKEDHVEEKSESLNDFLKKVWNYIVIAFTAIIAFVNNLFTNIKNKFAANREKKKTNDVEKKEEKQNSKKTKENHNLKEEKKETKKVNNKTKIDKKINLKRILCNIMIYFSLFMAFGCLLSKLYVNIFLWIIVAISFMPKLKEKIIEKNKISNKTIIIVRIVLVIMAFSYLAATPFNFEGEWVADNGMIISLSDEKVDIVLEDGTKLKGVYTYKYSDSIYDISITITTKGSKIKSYKIRYDYDKNIFCISFFIY